MALDYRELTGTRRFFDRESTVGTASQDGFASRRGRGRPGGIDQAEEEREEVTDDACRSWFELCATSRFLYTTKP